MPIINQMGIDAKIINDRMSEMAVDAVITYAEISGLIKRDILQHRSVLETARRAQLRDGRMFCTIRGEGLQRIDDAKKIDVAESCLGRVRSITRKSSKILAAVQNFNSLPNESKIKHNAIMSICGAVLQCSKPKSIKMIENNLAKDNRLIPVSETLEMFKK